MTQRTSKTWMNDALWDGPTQVVIAVKASSVQQVIVTEFQANFMPFFCIFSRTSFGSASLSMS